MVQFLSIIFFLGFLQFLLGFSKVAVFLCHPVQQHDSIPIEFGNFHTANSAAKLSAFKLEQERTLILTPIICHRT